MNVKLEDQLRGSIRLKQYSLRTEEAYVGWYRRFVLWHGKRHPREMGAPEVEAFRLAPKLHFGADLFVKLCFVIGRRFC